MPTYDYTCIDCRKRFDIVLTYAEYGSRPVACSHCGSRNVRRRVNRIRVLKSGESRMEALADPDRLAGLDDDPRSMARVFRELGEASGEELPPQFNEVVDRLQSGQSPEEIEKSVPDWGESMGAESFGGHEHSHDDGE